jgi:hypothetical protein
MVKLPFGTSLTDRFVAQLRDEFASGRSSGRLPSISWCRFYPYSGGVTERWAFASVPEADVPADTLFTIEHSSFHISPEDQHRMAGSTLDFLRGDGIVVATPTI